MKVSFYSTSWNVAAMGFDYRGALDNWAVYADEIVVAVPRWDRDTHFQLSQYADERGYPLQIVTTDFNLDGSEPLAYGRTENAALQACTGDLLIQQNLDERLRADPARLSELHALLQARYDLKAFFVPTIDLYGSADRYLSISRKWYVHGQGVYRGAANGTLKADGRPDYNRTSSDEAVDFMGNLVPTMSLIDDLSLPSLQRYVESGWPISFHLGYLSFSDRIGRSVWWKGFWERATGGDSNQHPSTIEELAARETKEHGLPLWPTVNE